MHFLLLFFSSLCVMVTTGWIFHIIKKKSNSPHIGPKQEEKWSEWVFSGCCTIGLYPYSGAPLPDRNSQSSKYGQNPAPSASYSDSASPVGLEFWLPGKISVLGERGLSFACSHPSCTTRKGPLSTSPVYKEHLHWWSAFACVCLVEKQQHLFQEWVFYSTRSPEGFGCGASGMWTLWEQHHPQTQTTAIDFSVNSTKKKERKKEKKTRGTIATQKNLVYWTIHFSSLWIPL